MTHQTITDQPSHLSAADLVALRRNLDEQRRFRQRQLRQLTADCAPSRGRAAAQAEADVRLAACARMVLADVEAALTRMYAGEYGSCPLCRRPIARQRLLVVPQARYCGPCQQLGHGGRASVGEPVGDRGLEALP